MAKQKVKPILLPIVAMSLGCEEAFLRQIINQRRIHSYRSGQTIWIWPREILRLRRLVRHLTKPETPHIVQN